MNFDKRMGVDTRIAVRAGRDGAGNQRSRRPLQKACRRDVIFGPAGEEAAVHGPELQKIHSFVVEQNQRGVDDQRLGAGCGPGGKPAPDAPGLDGEDDRGPPRRNGPDGVSGGIEHPNGHVPAIEQQVAFERAASVRIVRQGDGRGGVVCGRQRIHAPRGVGQDRAARRQNQRREIGSVKQAGHVGPERDVFRIQFVGDPDGLDDFGQSGVLRRFNERERLLSGFRPCFQHVEHRRLPADGLHGLGEHHEVFRGCRVRDRGHPRLNGGDLRFHGVRKSHTLLLNVEPEQLIEPHEPYFSVNVRPLRIQRLPHGVHRRVHGGRNLFPGRVELRPGLGDGGLDRGHRVAHRRIDGSERLTDAQHVVFEPVFRVRKRKLQDGSAFVEHQITMTRRFLTLGLASEVPVSVSLTLTVSTSTMEAL